MSRRNTELLLLIASAFPVILLYAMYVLTAGAAISFETLAVPIGLFAAFAAAHIAVRILAPGADPAILPIVFVLSGIGITFVTRLAPALAISQLIILFVSVALMVGTLALVKNLDVVMRYKYTFGIIGIILLMLPIFIGTTISAPSCGFASRALPSSPASSPKSLSCCSWPGTWPRTASCSPSPTARS